MAWSLCWRFLPLFWVWLAALRLGSLKCTSNDVYNISHSSRSFSLSELPRITPLVIAWLSMQVAVDAFITSTLIYFNLNNVKTDRELPATLIIAFSRSRTGFRKTDTVLNRLIRGAIQTGLLAGIFSMGDLISFVVLPTTNLYGMFAIPIGRIYTNVSLQHTMGVPSSDLTFFGRPCWILSSLVRRSRQRWLARMT